MRNISVKQYFKLKDTMRYDMILDHLQGENVFSGKTIDVVQLPYTNVKYCISLLQKKVDENIIKELFFITFEVSENEFYNATIVDYFKARNYLLKSFKNIQDNEQRLSQGGSVDLIKWQMAGADKLQRYDSTLPLDQLGERYSIYPFDLGRKPYSEIFYLMAQLKILNEVNYNYNKQQ